MLDWAENNRKTANVLAFYSSSSTYRWRMSFHCLPLFNRSQILSLAVSKNLVVPHQPFNSNGSGGSRGHRHLEGESTCEDSADKDVVPAEDGVVDSVRELGVLVSRVGVGNRIAGHAYSHGEQLLSRRTAGIVRSENVWWVVKLLRRVGRKLQFGGRISPGNGGSSAISLCHLLAGWQSGITGPIPLTRLFSSSSKQSSSNSPQPPATMSSRQTASSSAPPPKKPKIAPSSNQTTNPLLESLDISPHPRPFKNSNYKPPLRRNKNLKQILSDNNNTDPNRLQMQTTYQNIESAPSFRRGNKWCDVTGLPAKYTDPKTKLRYRDGEVYQAVRSLPAGGAEKYLEVRGANVVLK
jgi:INO80 complex subunit C